jgi:ABC-type thiamin/hydroxymethylpyrimidine transport system permease subunit
MLTVERSIVTSLVLIGGVLVTVQVTKSVAPLMMELALSRLLVRLAMSLWTAVSMPVALIMLKPVGAASVKNVRADVH